MDGPELEPEVVGLEVEQLTESGATRVRLRGELDAFTAESLRAAIDAATGDVVLDLAGVTFIDSSGLAAIIEATFLLAEDDRRLSADARSPVVQRLFDLSGVDERLHLT
jgi:anti-anti-sigma factor